MARISLILTPGFADWEYAFIGGTASPFYSIDVRFFAPTTGQINSQGGLAVTIDNSLQQCLDWKPDVFAVIGGMVWESVEAPDIRDFLHASRSNGATIAGICGGTLALARAGLLDDTPHTSNSADFLQENSVSYEGHARYQKSRVAVVANRIITAPGPAPVNFTCEVFEGAGLSSEIISQLRLMLMLMLMLILAAEHN